MEEKIDKRTKEYKDEPDIPNEKPKKPDLDSCSECGNPLPALPDGGVRVQPEACHDCIWKSY